MYFVLSDTDVFKEREQKTWMTPRARRLANLTLWGSSLVNHQERIYFFHLKKLVFLG